jgi:rhodanese-related sulfurtransferase
MQTIRTITREELSRLNAHDAHVFEVLSRQHWAAGHIRGAKAMPLDTTAEKLVAIGYRSVSVYAGGKADWKAAGFELEVAS